MGNLLSLPQYAELVGKQESNIRTHIYNGRIPAIRKGGRWYIDEETPYPADKRYKDGSHVGWRTKYGKATK